MENKDTRWVQRFSNYQKALNQLKEAVDLINLKWARSFETFEEFSEILNKWLSDDGFYLESAKIASDYVMENTGATAKVFNIVFANDLNKKQ